MSIVVEANVAFDPVRIGPLGPQCEMLNPSDVSDLFEQLHGRNSQPRIVRLAAD
jgi:hypothetical protein